MFLSKNTKLLRSNYKKKYINSSCINCLRTKSSAQPKTKTYSHTILLPKTNFPARSNNNIREEIQKLAQFSELYSWQRENRKGPEYVLHDGPPYANGDLHMGHAVNKIIKDINNRNQILQGNKVHYVPGWDCHGLPIELKALQKAKKAKQKEISSPENIRQIARTFALETVERQKAVFESWGIMADWDKQFYLTLSKDYVKNQLQLFYKMYEKGLIFRALKPVYWSPSSKTALAEAELEYDPLYKSTEVYVTFPIEKAPGVVQDAVNGKSISAVIWTTTPWTLVANRAVCYNPQMKYSIVTLSNKPGELFLIGSGLLDSLAKVLQVEITKVVEFDGNQLKGTTYRNKLVQGTLPFLAGDHVTEGKGTGLVHTAPAHGPDDFLIALKNNMPVECNVDESGRYINLDPSLNGLYVLQEGQEVVISQLSEAVIHRGTYAHSYPLDWRTKKPVILRASQQWFIDTAALKEQALEALDKVTILPQSSSSQARQGFRAQLEKRPYWCISRQRAWGVPIPAVYAQDRAVVDKRIVDKLCSLIEAQGPDAWWTCDVEQLLTEDLMAEHGLNRTEVVKGKDIMDIWFDSGVSWSGLGGRVAALYAEGVDQLTGWFQAALLTSIGLRGHAPYESIFVHGFVVDDKRRKMSKSIGNVIDPSTIMNGGTDKQSQPAYGVDTLRWWVASHATQHSQIVVSKKILDDCLSEVLRIRNTSKFLLGVVSDVNKTDFYRKPTLSYFDQYLLSETYRFLGSIVEFYSQFRYNYVSQSVLHFVSNKISGLYCQCVKDRLYCSPKDSNERLAAQLTAHTILVSLCRALGPILPHLVEEVWQHHPLREKPFYFTDVIPVLPDEKIDPTVMDAVLDIKKDICMNAKNESLPKLSVEIKLEKELFDKMNSLNLTDGVNNSVLTEILEVSSVNLVESVAGTAVEVSVCTKGQCLRCRKYNAMENSDKCSRCEKVLAVF